MPYIPDALTDSSPAAAVLGRRLYVAFKGRGSDHIYLASTDDPESERWVILDLNTLTASPESPDDEPAQIRTSHGPALTSLGNHLWLTFKGHDNPYIWQVALRERSGGASELLRFGRLDHAETAQGPSTQGPAMEPTPVGGGTPRRPMVVYRGNRDNGVWIHSYTTRTNSDLRLPGARTELAPAVAYGTVGVREEYFVVYVEGARQRLMCTQNHRVDPPGVQPEWPHPVPVASYAVTSKQPALTVHDGLLFLAHMTTDMPGHQMAISSWDKFWVPHGVLLTAYTDQGPALVIFQNRVYVVYRAKRSGEVLYKVSNASREQVRPVIVVSLSGASSSGSSSSWDFHDVVRRRATAYGYPLELGVNWDRDKGDLRVTSPDLTRVKDKINKLVRQNGGDKGQLSFLLVGKSAGGVLAWDTLRVYSEFAAFHRVALVLVDAHGSANDDERDYTYCQDQNLWWPDNFQTDRALFRVYNIYQRTEGLTGANFPDRRVYSNTRLSGSGINHDNIINNRRTHELITEGLKFALTGE